ncbi:arylformamidase [Kordiimonas sp. SCSIO 12610]|uniref:arylformamidase n=1 Tax=Kordiimonas sp. SCSIO 12610 TaxID=2829597 RepID=UPI002108961E|nr:arylformamidase [Kordiimonas sp. SCSIO 12610]UTW54709.1 arylformamidase [Kordiimonas sp. SCSIO 12610]
MSNVRIWDISQRLGGQTPLWPGEPDVVLTRNVTISDDCPVNVGALSFPLHAGTHADAPFHYSMGGSTSDQVELVPYIGPCVVVDVRHAGDQIELEDCDWSCVNGNTRVLFRTYDIFPKLQWDANFKSISPEVIKRLRELGVKLVGTDAASLDPQDSKTMDAHREILRGDMRILEGLVLDNIAAGQYELIALPIAIEGADASPVRAILRELKS